MRIWKIKSRSEPKKMRTVRKTKKGLRCNCPSFIFSKRKNETCRHIKKLEQRLGVKIMTDTPKVAGAEMTLTSAVKELTEKVSELSSLIFMDVPQDVGAEKKPEVGNKIIQLRDDVSRANRKLQSIVNKIKVM